MPEVRLFIVVPVIMALSFENICLAGPPWRTDDPEPVELGHWEVYLASQGDIHSSEFIATAPHIEVNYGAIQDVQLHVIAPFAYSKPTDGSGRYGYADMEVGAKYRFIQETDSRPQVGTFPILVQVGRDVKAKIATLAQQLPDGMKLEGMRWGEKHEQAARKRAARKRGSTPDATPRDRPGELAAASHDRGSSAPLPSRSSRSPSSSTSKGMPRAPAHRRRSRRASRRAATCAGRRMRP